MIVVCLFVCLFVSPSNNDRQWEFQCASGAGLANVSTACTLQVNYVKVCVCV